MQSDFLDKKIKEAADHHHPAYDEYAWKKMKKQLDKHMPEEKNRRRGLIFWIPLFLLLGGGAWLFTTQPWEKKSGTAANQEKLNETPQLQDAGQQAPSRSTVPPDEVSAPGSTNETSSDKTREENLPATDEPGIMAGKILATRKSNKEDPRSTPVVTNKNNEVQEAEPISIKAEPLVKNNSQVEKEQEPLINNIIHPDKPALSVLDKEKNEEKIQAESQAEKNRELEQPDNAIASDEKNKINGAQKDKNKKPQTLASRFFFYASTGPDFSFTSSNDLGETKLLLGGGAGFQLNDRIMLRTGLFSARKVYSAKPEDYDPPADFWNYYPNMQKIDANCKVYEVPLLVSYQFGKSTRQSWFATTGISTYIMKEEKYKYYYKPYPNSPTYTRDYTIKNRFEHHFSVVTLSGGYKRNFGKRMTVMAEPYFKVPLDGIGFGKVKLNSGGIMFSIGVRPFGK